MENNSHSSIYVAPLQIAKGVSRSAETAAQPRDALFSNNTFQTPLQRGQITPPLTPVDSETGFDRYIDFKTYLRAVHPYHPSCDENSSSVTLPLNKGDILLVHSVHTNGWADGTLLVSSARGWIPTNYCEAYDNEPIKSLLKALTFFWDLLKGIETEGCGAFRSSDYVRGFVAGVRLLLDKCSCLNRESSLIQSHNALRKGRKALLSDLSAFVKISKGLEEMILKAFKTVTRAVRFLDIYEDILQSIDPRDANYAHVPPTPPSDHSEFGVAVDQEQVENICMSKLEKDGAGKTVKQLGARPRYSRASQTFVRPGSSNSCRQSSRPPSKDGGLIAHRSSCTIRLRSQDLASVKLSDLHNIFLTCLGYFIGLHIQARSSAEILLTTKHAIESCRDMLDLIGQIWERDRKRSVSLQEAQDEMWGVISELATAARDVLKPLRPDQDEEILMPTEGKTLVDAATACVRAAGHCVAESRFVIERIGDFELVVDGTSDLEKATLAAADSVSRDDEHRDRIAAQSFPIPPKPSTEPPSAPLDAEKELPIIVTQSVPEFVPEPSQPQNVSIIYQTNAAPSTSSTSLSPAQDLSPLPSPLISDLESDQIMSNGRTRSRSLDDSSTGDGSTYVESARGSETGSGSTRGTSPDASFANPLITTSFSSDSQATLYEEGEEVEANILERTFAHELTFNKEGQITGGTLPALVERLTTHDSTPEPTFVSTFFLTFRLFATPSAFAQALIDRFQYVAESPQIASPVRLRVYNIFKGWLESHWRQDCDSPALEIIVPFATRQLQIVLPTAGKRLASLATKVTAASGPLVPRLVSSMGKTNTAIAQYVSPDTPLPASIISKSQMNALKNWKHGGANISILDFDPLELARQFTIKESQIFCSILPEELLATEWMKKSGSMAVNVRAMSRLSTDLTNLVADCILGPEDPKKRASVIKQWVKIAEKLLELVNYDSLMAIVCALDGSTILRLKRTWEMVSAKTKARLESLKSVVDFSRNFAVLRQRLQHQVPPCLPFVGTYLTDLTFVDIGNQTTRQLSGSSEEASRSVINFDKHVKTAKIISELQRFQIPYRLQEVPELQTWMQDQLVRVRTTDACDVTNNYRRSLLLEPRQQMHLKQSPVESQPPTPVLFTGKDKFDFFGIGWGPHSKEKLVTNH